VIGSPTSAALPSWWSARSAMDGSCRTRTNAHGPRSRSPHLVKVRCRWIRLRSRCAPSTAPRTDSGARHGLRLRGDRSPRPRFLRRVRVYRPGRLDARALRASNTNPAVISAARARRASCSPQSWGGANVTMASARGFRGPRCAGLRQPAPGGANQTHARGRPTGAHSKTHYAR
jgi:hypothetical protein